ncbi:hypothetical protein CONPUDRAFT_59162 [Coniophora puteana RWD-64-598 SS2]|uniref:mRNA decay factor PAT1 domain-containing protein n=1 Tax=Coniophora puteana (strain RWD-64-598) TaxID=741705 RepID=A0A5M3MJH9_CONPW|nr:uncharacterized protein CONPUDRAFT_59162 [Coniophora puteana RWD-64-598 SS2]EIW79273.1 hypothetical protein CONPUDRAFT_59162 [Coniophora puteana RWD-64-598 SS2]
MSFFGYENNDLEQEKRKFLEGGLGETEDLAVYTWGEESYDGLGDALVEGGDELNDETFGGTSAVGKDFDFSHQALPNATARSRSSQVTPEVSSRPIREKSPLQQSGGPSLKSASNVPSLESIWDDRSPFSMLPRANGASHVADHQRTTSKSPYSSHLTIDQHSAVPSPELHMNRQTGLRTLQEIEAEMQTAAKLQRQRQQEEMVQRQLAIQQEDQRRIKQEHLMMEQQEHMRFQREQQLRLQQQGQQQRTPPPRMGMQSHSPRFHQHQQQILLMQQEQERQQQLRLRELQEQLRLEEMERQFRAQKIAAAHQQDLRRHPSYQNIGSPQHRTQSPSRLVDSQQVLLNHQNSQPYLPQNIQMQQRLLSEMAQAEFLREMQGANPASQAEQEALRMEAMRKIMETERMEERRRRRAAKIAHMSRYNDLMTRSDKDFITRIQVSQLVTQDPYAEDFYAQVYGAIIRSRMGLQSEDERVLKFGASGGVGLGLSQKAGGRRQSAMQKMEAQVERIVSNARVREKEKGLHSLHSLQGALGKTSGRSYKAAPRQLLQVDAASASPTLSGAHPHISKDEVAAATADGAGVAREAAKLGREALGDFGTGNGVIHKDPLTHRQVLVLLESLYDLVLDVEQLRRDQPPPEEEEAHLVWSQQYGQRVEEIWEGLKVMVPLETSNPHPFISLLTPVKGKKILPRLSRHISGQRMLTLLTLLVACFSQLEVVKKAHYLDLLEDSPEKEEIERQTQAFLGSVLQSILPVVAKAELRLVRGLIGLFMERCDVIHVSQTRPGIALLTLFLSRVEVIKQEMVSSPEAVDPALQDEAQQWQFMFDHLFQMLAPHFNELFPSTRLAPQLAQLAEVDMTSIYQHVDIVDQPVWQFLAALSLHASQHQQSVLVSGLREKILENVTSANKGWVQSEAERQTKLANVNLFLNALGLDSSQISV